MMSRFVLLLCVMLPGVALAAPQPLGTIWRKGAATIVVTPCPAGGDHDSSCRAVEVRRGAAVDRLGGGYTSVTLLWTRPAGGAGPDALLFGDDGGSGGSGELFAVTLAPMLSVRRLREERLDAIVVHPGAKALAFDLPLGLEYFNGAPHAGVTIVPLPIVWRHGDFALALPALLRPSPAPRELDFRALAVGEEFRRWAQDAYPAPRLFPPEARGGTPVALQALVELVLSGHADQARAVLHRAWPGAVEDRARKRGGEDAFWAAVCRSLLAHQYWKRFGLARLPHAALVESGARAAQP